MFRLPSLLFAVLLGALTACQPDQQAEADPASSPQALQMPSASAFQGTGEGPATDLFVLENPAGIRAAITNYGGRLVSLWVKDQAGQWTDIVLGFDDLAQFKTVGERYYGGTIGRYGNRLANGQFSLDGETYQLPQNNGPNTLHGGPEGFHEQIWAAEQPNDSTLVLRYTSPDGEMGFPGTLSTVVTYTLTADPGMRIDYQAETDAPTVINLTNHAYYNLNGEGSGTINQHRLMIPAQAFTPVDSTLIPTGELRPVAGTPFDFQVMTEIGARIEQDNQQLAYGKGYDHNFVLTEALTDSLHLAAIVVGDQSGIEMEIWTQEPGLQFYGGNFMDGSHSGKAGKPYEFRTAFCLETQHFPDSPNQTGFPSTVLKPGESYRSYTLHRFGVVTP
jgi:aldose 1-epimerase